MVHFPAMNEVPRQVQGHEPNYPDEPDDKRYIILYPDDYQGHGIDVEGNVALLVNEDNAREIKQLAEDVINSLEDSDPTKECD
jgi:hypothetical protein